MADDLFYIKFAFRHPVVRSGAIAAVVGLCILVVVAAFIWYPASSRHVELEEGVSQMRGHLVMSASLDELQGVYHSMEKTLAQVEHKLDMSTSPTEFARALNALAMQNDVKIISKSYRDSQLKSNYVVQYQELTLQGDYKALRRFIAGLRDMPGWTLIKEARLRKKKGDHEVIGDFILASYQKQART